LNSSARFSLGCIFINLLSLSLSSAFLFKFAFAFALNS
jgi:hypothetical protein